MTLQFKKNRILHIVIVLILTMIVVLSGREYSPASADVEYTDVMQDLEAVENFDIGAYPADPNDNSLKVIQIGESSDNELFVYVYRPSCESIDLPATSIRMSTTVGNSFSPQDYKLHRLSSHGTLEKYIVEDFTVKADALRYYEIISIFRAWNADIDEEPGNDNTVSKIPYRIAKAYTASTVDGNVSYTCTEIETIEIKDKYVGYVNYSDGTSFNWGGVAAEVTSAHFVAFDTDKPIDKLMSASVQFSEQSVSSKLCINALHTKHPFKSFYDYTYGSVIIHDPITIKAADKAYNVGGGNLRPGYRYSWNRIQKTSEFLSDVKNKDMKLKDTAVSAFAKTKWVLNFYETTVSGKGLNDVWKALAFGLIGSFFIEDVECRMTRVSDVTVLRLEFETDGIVYNLGVVDNKQTGGKDPVGGVDGISDKLSQWLWWVIAGIVLIVILIIIVAVLPNGINVLITLITLLGKGLFIVLSLPFRFISWIVDCIMGKKGGDK